MTSRIRRLAAAAASAALLAATGLPQGSNSCSGAQSISGVGNFAFNNASATTDGQADTLCHEFGTGQIERDVWFAWTSPASDTFTVSTCGLTSIDSRIAIYSGTTCPALNAIACNDDACSFQSSVSFTATSGASYLIRLGVYPGSSGGSGQFQISQGGPSGGCDPAAVGPDVIVGDLSGISDWGAVGSVAAYSLGTTSCNIGDQELNWIASTNDHPVIAQNIYRLEEGRFEQIGQSWLKHGFTALQQELCCDCISSGTGSRLGVGCSDPYGSGLNGSQGGLGPRFEVNPFTGLFAYPFTAQSQTGNNTYKRIQVHNDDLSSSLHPSATYYGEGQYIAKDDAQAGNGENNVSWRPLTRGSFTSGSWDLSMSSFTRREEPAIEAWQDAEPSVTLVDVAVPSEGKFVVGYDVTDNGNGTWHYEYAIFNMNSDRSAGSLSIPIAANVNVTNVGFHDVDYHSGEPFDGTDWAAQLSGSDLTWSTDSFGTDPNANALRWGTLYNFRFDADTPPQNATVTLGLFKTGSPSSVTFSAVGPSEGDGGTTTYCSTSPNSAGPGALISSTGSTSISAGTFTLVSSGAIPNGFGLFFYGPAQIQAPFGDGFRCVGAGAIGIFRFNPPTQTNALGTAQRLVNFNASPAGSGAGMITPGSTWKFQHWYRDVPAGGAGFNLSNGLSATFSP